MASFWTDGSEDHKRIAEEFYRNIEIDSPDYVTSNRLTTDIVYQSSWAASCVKHYTYTGPRPSRL